ncbi:hypothetical protein BSKO_13332 [Bryopsis sp. KO-2023]|nr:hypothetical protein BSKO_13332 [Bryopsis sp. KO-2023]
MPFLATVSKWLWCGTTAKVSTEEVVPTTNSKSTRRWDLPADIVTEIMALLPGKKIAQHSCLCRVWSMAAKHPKLKQKTLLEKSWRSKDVSPMVQKLMQNGKICGVAQKDVEIAVGGPGFVRVWNTETRSVSTTCQDVPYFEISCIRWIGELILGGDSRGTIHGWDASTGKKVVQFEADIYVVCAIENLGNVLASGGGEQSIKLWKKGDWVLDKTLQGHTHRVCVLAGTTGGERLVSGSCDASVRVWDVRSRKCLHVLHGHMATVSSLTVCGDVIASGSEDFTVRLWGLSSGQCIRSFVNHKDWLGCVDLNGKLGVSGAWDKTVKVWNAAEEEECLQSLNVSSIPQKVWFDGEKLVAVTSKGELWIWDFSIDR